MVLYAVVMNSGLKSVDGNKCVVKSLVGSGSHPEKFLALFKFFLVIACDDILILGEFYLAKVY